MHTLINNAYQGQFIPAFIANINRRTVYDADSPRLLISLFSNETKEVRTRLFGINAYEMRGSEKDKGKKGRARLIELIENQPLIIRPVIKLSENKDNRQTWGGLRMNWRTGKYGRHLILLYRFQDILPFLTGTQSDLPTSINQMLINEAHAKFADYGKRMKGKQASVMQLLEKTEGNPIEALQSQMQRMMINA